MWEKNRSRTLCLASRLLQEDESQSRVKEERKEEDVTPKSEAATAGTKEEPDDHDSEDSFRPEHVVEEAAKADCRVSTSCGSSPATTHP